MQGKQLTPLIFGIGEGARLRNGGRERVQEIGVRVDADQLCGLAEGVEERGDVSATRGSRAVMILAADDWTTQRSLGGIVVQGNARVRDKARQACPALEHVADRFPEIAAREARLFGRPFPHAIEY